MGRKVHPIGFRLGINKTWEGRWFAEGNEYVDQLHQDFALRDLVRKEAVRANVSRVDVERFPGKVKVIVHTAKPGVLIGLIIEMDCNHRQNSLKHRHHY